MTLSADDPAAHIAFANVRMAYGDREVFRSLSCAFPRGKISVILGGSGSGKSTLLRLIGGLVRPCEGAIVVAGIDVTRLSETALYSIRSKIGMLFQGGALLDSLTVFENIAFPVREHTRKGEDEIAHTVHERLADVGLSDVDQLLPPQLSGGMLRRVALARAIVMSPEILLCDEPFSGLDPLSTRRIETLLVDINRRSGMTLVIVSHDVASTMRMADHVVLLLEHGTVAGSPAALRDDPDPRMAEFLTGGLDLSVSAGPSSRTDGGEEDRFAELSSLRERPTRAAHRG